MAPANDSGEDMMDGRKVCNGFFMRDEPASLSVAKENIAEFSLPQEALSYEPSEDLITHQFSNGDSERKIHCNTELTKVELGQLKQMQENARSKQLVFYPSVCVMASRFISRARGDVTKALALMSDTQAWRETFFQTGPIADGSVIDDIRHGILYFVGRDKALRPTIICRANRIPAQWFKDKDADRLIRIVIFCMEYMVRYMLHPGRVEGTNLIVDLKGIGPTQVPFAELKKLYSVTSHHYIGRVFKFYIVNMSYWFQSIAGLVMKMLTDRQRQKINILHDCTELQTDYALHQLEVDHGGSRPLIEEFFPFPLQQGPFEAGYSKGPAAQAVRRVHEVFTPAGSRGSLWDPNRTHEENIRLEFAAGASAIFRKCGLLVPAQLANGHDRETDKLVGGTQSKGSDKLDVETGHEIAVGNGRDTESHENVGTHKVTDANEGNGTSLQVEGSHVLPIPSTIAMSDETKVPTPCVSRAVATAEGVDMDANSGAEVQGPIIQTTEVKQGRGFFGSLFSCSWCTTSSGPDIDVF
eukprot:TRINITY_DN6685_c0_g1_i1.p1 TRINITY_DN6685_c0_g1~~TRINITY_DN6685_c0_g1_i1.p1  ORF type:complete len:526 (+),score=59.60 TRINITY_DN6685_c0_g1_i1:125-1702(+)